LATCSQTDVTTAIGTASAGDVLVCPAGSWSWSSVSISKNITLQGAGIGSTNISITANNGLKSAGTAFRLTGFTFISTGNFGDFDGALLYIPNGHDWRIDHNEFQIFSNSPNDGTGGNGLHIKYDASGLIDHNRFIKTGECSRKENGKSAARDVEYSLQKKVPHRKLATLQEPREQKRIVGNVF